LFKMGTISRFVRKALEHPLSIDLSVDDPDTTLIRRAIVEQKGFLRCIYLEWYKLIIAYLQESEIVLELGSGPGFLNKLRPSTITSEILSIPDVSLIANGCQLPFAKHSLDAIVMTNVMHHISDISAFFDEASFCIRPGGKILLVEPWRSGWSEWVYKRFHPEPFLPYRDWTLPEGGPLSSANGALPWILFWRDKKIFESRHSDWEINIVKPLMPFSYLASGGVSLRSFVPSWCYSVFRLLERPWESRYAMFAFILLKKKAL